MNFCHTGRWLVRVLLGVPRRTGRFTIKIAEFVFCVFFASMVRSLKTPNAKPFLLSSIPPQFVFSFVFSLEGALLIYAPAPNVNVPRLSKLIPHAFVVTRFTGFAL